MPGTLENLKAAIAAQRDAAEKEYDDALDVIERRRLDKLEKCDALDRLADGLASQAEGGPAAAAPPTVRPARDSKPSSPAKPKSPAKSAKKAAAKKATPGVVATPALSEERRSKVLQAMAKLGGNAQEGVTQAEIEKEVGFKPVDHLKRLETMGKVKRLPGKGRSQGKGYPSPCWRLAGQSAGQPKTPTSKPADETANGKAKKAIKAAVARIMYTFPDGEEVAGSDLVAHVRHMVGIEAQNSEVVAAALDELVADNELVRVARDDRKGFNYKLGTD